VGQGRVPPLPLTHSPRLGAVQVTVAGGRLPPPCQLSKKGGDILWELIFIWIPCTGRCRAQNAADRDKAQHQVERYYAKMYERGYFRDSYNRTSLLWLFGLSWWLHIGLLLEERDEGCVLSPANAMWLLDFLRRHEAVFEGKLQPLALAAGERQPIVERYFRDKYAYFQEFLLP